MHIKKKQKNLVTLTHERKKKHIKVFIKKIYLSLHDTTTERLSFVCQTKTNFPFLSIIYPRQGKARFNHKRFGNMMNILQKEAKQQN